MEGASKTECFSVRQVDNKTTYECKICGRCLSTKQRILTHLNKKHNKSPLKRVYKQYEYDPSVPIPKRTAIRQSSARQSLFDNSRRLSDLDSDINQPTAGQSSAESCITQFPTDPDADNIQPIAGPSSAQASTAQLPTDPDADNNQPTAGQSSAQVYDTQLPSDQDSDNNQPTAGQSPAPVYDTQLSSDKDSNNDSIYSMLSVSDNDSTSDSSTETDNTLSSESELDSELSDFESSADEMLCDEVDKSMFSEKELNALCLVSYFLRHNSSAIAIKDLLNLLKVLCPESSQFKDITYDEIMSLAGNTNCKTIDYCSACNQKFPDDPDVFQCETDGCMGLRYKGQLPAQQRASRQPRNSFVLADVEKQLKFILERKGAWSSIEHTKQRINQNDTCAEITDISDGQFYRTLCQPGQFLSSSNNISALFNTDGIPLYSSSNVKLWPVFLALNELPPSCRFARENMILAAIWQGKDKPPFAQYMCAFGEQMCKLYKDGVQVKPNGSTEHFDVRLGVFVGTMDLQAKAYVLNMTMHNGAFGCSTCEESGESVKQGKGYARLYPYRSPEERPDMRESDNVKYEKGATATVLQRQKGYSHFKATEYQTWLLFYSLPCLNGYLDDIYLHHLALLSEGIYLLLGDNITEDNLLKAESLLDSFYRQFAALYGEGSCGLNVHNIGAHMVFYVRMWGPLWCWSCFPFEDWNAALLQSVHGTGTVTKQCLRVHEIQLKLNCINLNSLPHGDAHSYLVNMKKRGKTWSTTTCDTNVSTAGALKSCADLDQDDILHILNETGCQNIELFKKSLRVQVNGQKLYSEEYSRMKKRICDVVRCKNGQLRKVKYFIVKSDTNSVFAVTKKVEVHQECFICETDSQHIIRVTEATGKAVFPVEEIAEKVLFMTIDDRHYVACMPNSIGHSIFK